jgi:hypothetical protein
VQLPVAVIRRPPHATLALVSFCNAVASPESALALVDLSSGDLREVPFDYVLADYGATGLARITDGRLVVGLPGSRRLVVLSPDLHVVGQLSDDGLDDIHSAAVRGESLFVLATGSDSIKEYRIDSDRFDLVTTRRLTQSGRDSLHVNSLCVHGGRVVASIFGENWRDFPVGSSTGAIIDIDDGRRLWTSLTQPHTLVSAGEELYVLGSFTGAVERLGPDGERQVCATYPGYLRGMAFFDDGALVGVSGKRKRSRGLGTENASGLQFDHRGGIIWYSRDWEVKAFIDLSWFGREIFDVLVVGDTPAVPSPADTSAAARHRSVQLDASWEAPEGGPRPPDPPSPLPDGFARS